MMENKAFLFRGVWILAGSVALLALGVCAGAQTPVRGALTGDTVWTLDGSPYRVTGDLTLVAGAKLTIEPGVTIEVAPDQDIMIHGLLIAIGEKEKPITFTSASEEAWGILHFTDFTEDAVVDEALRYISGSVLQHCIVERGRGIFCRFGSPLISKCTIRKNQSSGIRVEHGAPVIVDNLIYENSTELDPAAGNGAGIIAFTEKEMIIARNVLRDNRSVDGRYGGGGICAYAYKDGFIDIRDNTIFNNYSSTHAGGLFAYRCAVRGNVVIGNRCDLDGGGIRVIECEVTGNLVDSNQGKGGGGIYAESSSVRLNSIVRNRSGASYGGGLFFFGSGAVTHNTIMYNESDGPSKSAGVYVSGGPSITENTIYANRGYGLYTGNPSQSPVLDARKNDWGLPTQQQALSAIYDWFDDSERGLVDYSGYRAEADEQAPPAPPGGVTLTSAARGLHVRWSPGAPGANLEYTVHYGPESGYPYPNAIDAGAGNHGVISGLERGSVYYVAVTARRNDGGKPVDRSAFSEQLAATFTGRQGRSPDQPENRSPALDAVNGSLEPTLTATAFAGAGGGKQAASRWQITAAGADYTRPVFDTGPSGAAADRVTVPKGALENGRRYAWRVAYMDPTGNWSPWSAETAFAAVERDASHISGPIAGETRWTLKDSPYVVTGNTLVKQGATLAVDPGVTVRLHPDSSFMVRGKIVAVGEEARPITFTKHADQSWDRFIFADPSADAVFDADGNRADGSILRHCVVEYGKGVVIEACSPFLTESVIRYHAASGLTIRKGGPIVSGNRIVENSSESEGGGIYVYTNDFVQIEDNVIRNNRAGADGGGIFAYGYSTTTSINMRDNEISGNACEGSGGGIYASRATIAGNTISDNRAAALGGGIYTTFSIIDRNAFVGNAAEEGGGIFAERNSTIRYNRVSENSTSSLYGGGVYLNYWGASVENEVFSFNDVTENRAQEQTGNGGVFVNGVLIFEQNNIFGNAGYDLYNGNLADLPPLEARDCYWGTTDHEEIESLIFHNKDDERLALVAYEPFAAEKRPTGK